MKIALFGANGRVGKRVCEIATKRGHTLLPIEKDTPLPNEADVAIDFSLPQATERVCNFCAKARCPLVSGVTGRNDEEEALINALSQQVRVVCKPNFSVGIAMLERLCQIVARHMPDWDCEICETHRRDKKDSPSGTAKALASAICQCKSFKKVTVHSLRCGTNFGRHEVVFGGQGESLTLVHQAENVDVFALGAVLEAESIGLSQNVTDV